MSIRDDLRQRVDAIFEARKIPAMQPSKGESCMMQTLGDATCNFSEIRATESATRAQQIRAKPRGIRLSSATGYATATQQLSCTGPENKTVDATVATVAKPIDDDAIKRSEAFEERAAIIEFDGGVDRAEAERLALIDDHWREFESLLAIVGPAYRTPADEYPIIREGAKHDLANALIAFRELARQCSNPS